MPGTPPVSPLNAYFYVTFQVGQNGEPTEDYGPFVVEADFSGMMNNGYKVSFKVRDAYLELLNTLIELNYFVIAKTQPVYIKFQFRNNLATNSTPDNATPYRIAIVTNMEFDSGPFERGSAYIHAVDPATYFLSTSFGDGGVIVGRLDNALSKFFAKEIPSIKATISKFRGSDTMRWYLLRMDYKTFLMNALEYGAGLTYDQTGILLETDGTTINITTQGHNPSRQRRFYNWGQTNANSVKRGYLQSNNSQFVIAGAIASTGTPSTFGGYFSSDNESSFQGYPVFKYCIVDELYSGQKQIPRIPRGSSFLGPDPTRLAEAVTNPKTQLNLGIGLTSLKAMPEMYSGGEVGVPYYDYLDGKARAYYFGLLNNELKGVITVPGDGEFADTKGLGVDTVYIRWTIPNGNVDGPYWGNGNWIVHGFHHKYRLDRKSWNTDIHIGRWDSNGTGSAVPSK